MAADPAFASTPIVGLGQVTAANTARDGTGTLVTLVTGGASGTKIEEITIDATVTTTAGMIRLFISTDAGTNKRLFDEIPVTAVTPSATVPAFRATRYYTNLFLPNTSALLYAGTNNAEAMNVFAFGGNF